MNLEMTRVMLNLYVVLEQVYFKIRSILLRSFALKKILYGVSIKALSIFIT